MSSTEAERVPGAGARRLRRPEKRALFWVTRLKAAPDGNGALNDAWSWLRKEVLELEDRDHDRAEAARYHVARQVAVLASQITAELRSEPAGWQSRKPEGTEAA